MKHSGQLQCPIDERVREGFGRDRREDIGMHKPVAAIVAEDESGKPAFNMRQSTACAEFPQYAHALRMSDLIRPLVLGALYPGGVHGVSMHVDMPILYGGMRGECNGVVIG